MKKTVVIVLMVAGLAILTTGIAMAQSPQPPFPRGGGMGPGRFYAAQGEAGPLHEYMVNAMSGALGISAADFEARRDAGNTAYQIALDLGFKADEIPALLQNARLKALDAAADAGVITPDQLSWMKSRPSAMGLGNCDGTGQHLGYGTGGWRFQQANP